MEFDIAPAGKALGSQDNPHMVSFGVFREWLLHNTEQSFDLGCCPGNLIKHCCIWMNI